MYKSQCFALLLIVFCFASCNNPFKRAEPFNTEDFLGDSIIAHINSPDTCDGLATIENEKNQPTFLGNVCVISKILREGRPLIQLMRHRSLAKYQKIVFGIISG